MAKICVIGGPSSTGKSTSIYGYKDEKRKIDIEGLNPKETFIINSINSKMLPTKKAIDDYSKFKKNKDGKFTGNMIYSHNYSTIIKTLKLANKNPNLKYIVIDDFQYLMSLDFFDRKDEAGFAKFGKIGFSIVDIIFFLAATVREDIIVFILTHTDRQGEGKDAIEHLKTIGKMLEEKFTFEGLFLPVLTADKEWKNSTKKMKWFFRTEPSWKGDITKAPLGMFDDNKIPNDLGFVAEHINNFLK